MLLSELPDEQCHLRTSRLELATVQECHVDALWPHVTDPTVTQYLAWDVHPSKDVTLAVVKALIESKRNDRGITWSIFHGGELCGLISFIDVVRSLRTWTVNRAELAYWLGKGFRKNGFMTEACHRVMKFGFDQCGFHRIIVMHAAENEDSARVIDRLGFQYVGEDREAFQKNGVWHSLKRYDILAREFNGN